MSTARSLIEAHLRAYSEFLATQPAGTVDAVHALFAEENRRDAVVLPRNAALAWMHHDTPTHRLVAGRRDDQQHGIGLQTPWIPAAHEKAGLWYGSEQRIDEDGRPWSRRVLAVCDDFGDLVEVSA